MRIKTCYTCGEVKPRTDYTKAPTCKDGHSFECRTCANRRKAAWRKANPERNRAHLLRTRLKHRYGITTETYETMLAAQDRKCAICFNICSTNSRLSVDHCHTSGAVRGLLCDPCNRGLGAFRDNPAALRSALVYLDRASQPTKESPHVDPDHHRCLLEEPQRTPPVALG